jgi:hypothetical protein
MGYRYLAGIHGIPSAYLYWFEKYLQDAQQDPTVSIPWWDWSFDECRVEGIPKAFAYEKANGNPNPLYKFHVILADQINLRPFKELTKCPKVMNMIPSTIWITFRSSNSSRNTSDA